jgi:DNA-binding response OmpR family regulator
VTTRPKKILLADDDVELVRALELRCRSWNLDVQIAHDGAAALALIMDSPPDLVCLDVSMPAVNGMSVCEALVSDDRFASMPVIILTGRSSEDVVRRCHRAAAYYVPKSTDVWSRVAPLLIELLELKPTECPGATESAILPVESEHPSRLPRVLCIDDDDELSHSLRIRLEAEGFAVSRSAEGVEGYRIAFRRPVDAVILDYHLPDGRGDYVLRRLKENPMTKDVPVIVLTGVRDHSVERRLLNLGAVSYLNKPLVFAELLAELREYIGTPALSPTSCGAVSADWPGSFPGYSESAAPG